MRNDIAVGCVVRTASTPREASLAGVVVKVNRLTVDVHARIRFSPTGPWFDQTHRVPKASIAECVAPCVCVCGPDHDCRAEGCADDCEACNA